MLLLRGACTVAVVCARLSASPGHDATRSCEAPYPSRSWRHRLQRLTIQHTNARQRNSTRTSAATELNRLGSRCCSRPAQTLMMMMMLPAPFPAIECHVYESGARRPKRHSVVGCTRRRKHGGGRNELKVARQVETNKENCRMTVAIHSYRVYKHATFEYQQNMTGRALLEPN